MPDRLLPRLDLETRIVCAAARTQPSAATLDRLAEDLGAGPDWARLWDLGHRHEVIPLIAGPIERAAAMADLTPPPSWTADVHRRVAATLVQNTARAEVLGRVLDAFAAADVPVIPVKGIATAVRWYGGLGTRPCADVDVLVRPEDLPLARRALLEAGLKRPANGFFAAIAHEYHDPAWIASGPTGRIVVELHRGLWSARAFGIDPAALWADAVPSRLLGRDVLVLSAPDALLHLAIHRTRSALRLRWVADVAELAGRASSTLDWDEVVRRAGVARARTATWTVLDLASGLLGAPVPPDVLEALAPRRPKRIVLDRTAGVDAMFRPRPASDVTQQPSLTLRVLEQDGGAHIAASLARGLRRSVRRILHERGLRRLPARVAMSNPDSGS